MKSRLHGARLLLVLVLGGALGACSASPSTDGASLAARVADTVEDRTGVRPSVDCGQENLSIADGSKLTCVITPPGSDEEYAAEVSITNPDGATEYGINLLVQAKAEQ